MVRLKLLSMRLGFLILLYSGLRALFLAVNFETFREMPIPDILAAFGVGLRFDVAAICAINGAFIFLSLLPGPLWQRRWYQKLLNIMFLVSNVPFLIINVVDAEYFKFIGQRSTLSLFDMAADLTSQIGHLTFYYWYLTLIGVAVIFALCYFMPRGPGQPGEAGVRHGPRIWMQEIAVMIVIVSLAVIGGRGGWQRRVISSADAEVFDKLNLAHLALNSSFTLIRSQRGCDAGTLSKVRFFPTDAELQNQWPHKSVSRDPKKDRYDNIVIIIIESLSAEYTGMGDPRRGYTPFLDSFAQRGIVFRNHFANARRSIDAPPAILAGLPHLSDTTFHCSMFKTLHGIGSLLKERGYQTSFFHGGVNGTMYFDVFSKKMGFDRYYGLNEYPNPADSDGIWGIYDEPFLQFMAQELAQYKEPFASVMFTLSSHTPFKIPPQYQGVFPTGENPMIEAVAYTDHALKKFFATVEKMPWYKNTLFVITGDHTSSPKRTHARMLDAYRVPLILFHPGGKLPKVDPERIAQHADIGPTLMDFLGIVTDRVLPFGHSIFDPSFEGLALSQINGTYWMAHKGYYLEYRMHQPSKLFELARLDSPITDKPEVKQQLEKKLEAYIQYFNRGLAENKLYRWREGPEKAGR